MRRRSENRRPKKKEHRRSLKSCALVTPFLKTDNASYTAVHILCGDTYNVSGYFCYDQQNQNDGAVLLQFLQETIAPGAHNICKDVESVQGRQGQQVENE